MRAATKKIMCLAAAATLLAATNPALAQGRGRYCGESAICDFTGVVVALIILAVLVLSVIANISEKGLIRGITEHKGLQGIFLYLALVAGLVWVATTIASYNKEWAIIFCLVAMVILYKLSSYKPATKTENNGNNEP